MPQRSRPLALLVTILFLISLYDVKGQEGLITHASMGVGLILPVESFQTLSGTTAPDNIDFSSSGIAVRPWFVAGADVPIYEKLRIGGALGYRPYALDFSTTETLPIATASGDSTLATFGHQLNTSFYALSLEPYFRYEPLNWLGINVGLPVSFLIQSDYTQRVEIVNPDSISFVDGSKSQLVGTGDVGSASGIIPGISAHAEFMYPIDQDKKLNLTFSAGFVYQLGSWSSASSLHSLSADLGVGVRYGLGKSPAKPAKPRKFEYVRDTVVMLSSKVKEPTTELIASESEEFAGADTVRVVVRERYHLVVPKPPAVLRASISLAFETEGGKISDEARLRVSKVQRTRMVPILPIVIFDGNQTSIPSRYRALEKSEAKRWLERRALTDPNSHWQYHLLNIVGSRMRDTASTELTVLCFDDGTPSGAEIAERRVENVKQYLTNTFGVSGSRIATEVHRGQASQQPWVFVSDTTRRLTRPIIATDTVSETMLPRVRISPQVVSEAGIRTWSVKMIQRDSLLHLNSGNGDVPATLVWDMNGSIEPDRVFGAPVQAVIRVEDNEGNTSQSEPSTIALLGPTTIETPSIVSERYQVLRWIGADYLHTPDIELFGLNPVFNRIDVYPSPSRRDDFFAANAPAVVHPVNAPVWFRSGLQNPELELFNHAEVYTNEKRRP